MDCLVVSVKIGYFFYFYDIVLSSGVGRLEVGSLFYDCFMIWIFRISLSRFIDFLMVGFDFDLGFEIGIFILC